ncbi:hypothetical protein HanIR_Chr09g0407611 [Helianthus annuus]|nr:hypothetical protein HanIR_Chr09g0407611 [Helianthus annuus]
MVRMKLHTLRFRSSIQVNSILQNWSLPRGLLIDDDDCGQVAASVRSCRLVLSRFLVYGCLFCVAFCFLTLVWCVILEN